MEWWTPQQAGLIGALVGGIVGGVMVGAIGGGVCGPLAARGKGRAFVLSYSAVCAAIGLAIVLTGIVAAAIDQPFHVWFWLFQPGVIVLLLSLGGVVLFRRVYAQHDRRRLAAEEFRRA